MTEQRRSGNAGSVTKRLASTLSSIVIIASLGFPASASAQWQFGPALRVAGDYDDNPTLTPRTDEKESISGYIGQASLAITYNSPTNTFYFEPIVRTRQYDSELDYDSDDQFANFRARHDGQSSTFSVRGNYARESVRTAELADSDLDEDLDPDEIEDDDSGIIDLSQRREKFRIVPRWAYDVSGISKIVADVNYLSVDYSASDLTIDPLVDYTDIRGRVSYERDLSQRNQGVLSVTARNYQSDRTSGDISGYGVSAGFQRALSETTTFRALLGIEETDGSNNDSQSKAVYDVSLVRNQQTTRLLAQYRRRISASGIGTVRARDELNLQFIRDLNERFSAGIGARAYQTNSLGSNNIEQDYVLLHARFLWRVSQAFSVQADYRHTVIDRSVVVESANSNQFTLWFNYVPKGAPELRMRNR